MKKCGQIDGRTNGQNRQLDPAVDVHMPHAKCQNQVETFFGLFGGAAAFNRPLDNWNTSNVVDFSFCFADASSFNQTLNWSTGKAKTMRAMFSAF